MDGPQELESVKDKSCLLIGSVINRRRLQMIGKLFFSVPMAGVFYSVTKDIKLLDASFLGSLDGEDFMRRRVHP